MQSTKKQTSNCYRIPGGYKWMIIIRKKIKMIATYGMLELAIKRELERIVIANNEVPAALILVTSLAIPQLTK